MNLLLVGLNGIATAGSHQTVHLTVTPGLYFSNLTSLPLLLHLHGNLTGPNVMPCTAGTTLPLLQMWAADPSAAPPRAESPQTPALPTKRSTALAASPPCVSPAAHAACLVSIAVAGVECLAPCGDAVLPGATISLVRATARERLEVMPAPGCSTLLTYRVLSAHGYQHLVVFQVHPCNAAYIRFNIG